MEIEDLPTSQYVSLEGRMSDLSHVLTWGWGSGLGTRWEGRRCMVPALKELLEQWGRHDISRQRVKGSGCGLAQF